MPQWWIRLYPATTEKLTKKWFFQGDSEYFTDDNESNLYEDHKSEEGSHDEVEQSFEWSEEFWQMVKGASPLNLAEEGVSDQH